VPSVEEENILLHRPRVRPNVDNIPISLLLRHLRRPVIPVRYTRSRSTIVRVHLGRIRRQGHEDEFG
jgi:hypothetical protein